MRTSKLLFLSASVLATALFAHCSSSTQGTCQETATCPPDASDGPPPLVCDTTKDPSTQAGCLDDRVGVFVDGTGGNDGNAGTKASPVKTIAKALTLATALTRVYVCEGTYAEDVTLDASHDGVSIFAGYKCGDWSYTGNKAQIGASTLALKIDSTTKPITIEDVFVKAADATAPGGSSVAAFVNGASGAVSFVRVNLTAGTGKNAADGVTGTNYSASMLPNNVAIKGHDATGGGSGNGTGQLCTGLCMDNVVGTGGAGGSGGTSVQGGATGSGSPSSLGGTAGNANQTCVVGQGSGGNGGDQTTPGADATSPTAYGALTAAGWTPSAGANATNGKPGGGGGGGGGASFADNSAGGGGGGACGGCGGAGGAGGAGGGASIALASLSSTVSLVGSELHAGNAGNGGQGAAGEAGQAGGLLGKGSTPGCDGGNGGKGSAGGFGAGGVGGISVGILYKGTAPTADSATTTATTTGTFGTKGVGGNAGQNDGIDGVAQAVLQAP